MSTITGNAGLRFNLTESDTTTDTGTVTQTYTIEDSVGDLTLTDSDKIFTITGTIGTSAVTLDLNDIANTSGGADATAYDLEVTRNQDGDLTTIKALFVHNKSTSATVTLSPADATSFLPASEQITIPSGCANGFSYGTAQTISTSGQFKIVSDTTTTTVEIYILGT